MNLVVFAICAAIASAIFALIGFGVSLVSGTTFLVALGWGAIVFGGGIIICIVGAAINDISNDRH